MSLLISPAHPTPAQEHILGIYGLLSLRNLKIDEKTDQITAHANNYSATGSVIRGGFELGWGYCRVHMTAGDEAVVKGVLVCLENGIRTRIKIEH